VSTPSNTTHVYQADIRRAVRAIGLSGHSLCVHSSLRSFGRVVGGAETVLQGLLEEGCTVMVPTFTYDYKLAAPLNQRPLRNGTDYPPGEAAAPTGGSYSLTSTEVSSDMGALPAALLRRSGRVRGDHPLDSFAALGPHAETLIAGQTSLAVYAPFERLAAFGGYVVLMGVGLTRMTLLHYAEVLAGRNLFWRWANDRTGKAVSVRVGGCSEGFEGLARPLADLEVTTQVGQSYWRAYPVVETSARAAATIRADPDITRCADPSCERCRDAVRGGPPGDPAFVQRMVRSWR
jgi:aminoglycoside N3'-acetyltransferase